MYPLSGGRWANPTSHPMPSGKVVLYTQYISIMFKKGKIASTCAFSDVKKCNHLKYFRTSRFGISATEFRIKLGAISDFLMSSKVISPDNTAIEGESLS